MKKQRLFIQTREFNNEETTSWVFYECSDVQAQYIVDNSEGHVDVMVADTMSSPEGTSKTVTGGLPIAKISMVHNEGIFKSFGGKSPWLFKNTVSVVDLQNQFKTHEPYSGSFLNDKPDKVFPKISHMGAL